MPLVPARATRALRGVRSAVLLRRRALAALCVGLAVWTGLRVVAGPTPATTPVLVAAHDLPAGSVVEADDLVSRSFPPALVTPGALGADDLLGRTLAAPVSRGEPLTRVRLAAPGLLAGYPGLVAVPVRLPDADSVALLRIGDRVDLLATDLGTGPSAATTRPIAHDVVVLALPGPRNETSLDVQNASVSGRLVVVGSTPEVSEMIADASVRMFLTVVWTR